MSCEIEVSGKGVTLRIHAPVPIKEQQSARNLNLGQLLIGDNTSAIGAQIASGAHTHHRLVAIRQMFNAAMQASYSRREADALANMIRLASIPSTFSVAA